MNEVVSGDETTLELQRGHSLPSNVPMSESMLWESGMNVFILIHSHLHVGHFISPLSDSRMRFMQSMQTGCEQASDPHMSAFASEQTWHFKLSVDPGRVLSKMSIKHEHTAALELSNLQVAI